MSVRVDDAVIGSGIVGLALAYTLAKSGRRVTVFDRGRRPDGASVRNFGTLWPIGQPQGPRRAMALRSVAIWKDVLSAAHIWFAATGSLHVAYHDDEWQVLSEFASSQTAGDAFRGEVIGPQQARARCGLLKQEGLVGALWNPDELQVNPRAVMRMLPEWLSARWKIHFERDVTVTAADSGVVRAGQRAWACERIWIAPGDDLRTLFPEELAALGLRRCKLQMMRTAPTRWELGTILAGGLTLTHYESFTQCPSRPSLARRLAAQWPGQTAYGIHVLAAQHDGLQLVLGDSHEYDDDVEPFDKAQIEALVLEYLQSFLPVTPPVTDRWHGVYVKHPDAPYCVLSPSEGVVAVAGLGGHGMTLAFGLAEEVVQMSLD